MAVIYWTITTLARDLPRDLTELRVYRPERATQLFSSDGEKIGEFFLQRRKVVPLERIPLHVQQAFLAAEDGRFYQHPGFDIFGIARAGWANLRGGGTRQGASTITQQVARMLLLSNRRTVERKIKEIILAVRIEREVPKRHVLEIYLNHVYLGHGAYGVQAAAEVYFAKDVEHVTVAEAAILAGLPKAPSDDSPFSHPERARVRQLYVLGRMHDLGMLSSVKLSESRAEPIAVVSREIPLAQVSAPYFVEHVRKLLVAEYGDARVLEGGLRVYTTLSMTSQRAAENAVRWGLEELDRRLPFRGPVGHLDAAALVAFTGAAPQRLLAPAPTPGAAPLMQPLERPEPLDSDLVAAAVTRITEAEITVAVGTISATVTPTDLTRLKRWRSDAVPAASTTPTTPASPATAGKPASRPRSPSPPPARLAIGDVVTVRLAREQPPESRRPPKRGKRPAPNAPPPAAPRWLAAVSQTPDVQAALLAMDPHTGEVRAMVGGYDYAESQFNRATQAHRQAGSSIKPLIYAAAIDSGKYHQLSLVLDAPVRVPTAGGIWAPQNYKPEYLGLLTLRTALAKSINTISVRLVAALGVDDTITMFKRLGLGRPGDPAIPRHPSIAVGTPDVTLSEMATAYATFPSGGLRVEPRVITRIVGDDGELPLPASWPRAPTEAERILGADTAYVMVDLMQGVVESGTARRAQALGRPAAGKTGTSTGYRDAWFLGYTTDLLAGVWVGRDNFTPIGGESTGGATALPIWLRFMQVAHPPTPVQNFPLPPGVLVVRASELTGLPAEPGAPGSRLVAFKRGTLPRAFGGGRPAPLLRPTPAPSRQPVAPGLPASDPDQENPPD
ncbi:MAG: PBP1A family penicillin-binding protein [Deltaproteobacteria bacterium]|nr:PBP1A family penicillin-binding protein [Deltaproteobacteria bacterium]